MSGPAHKDSTGGSSAEQPAAALEGAPSPAGSVVPGSPEWFDVYKASLDELAEAGRPPSICDLVIGFNAGGLNGDELQKFSGHLVDCPSCQAAIDLDLLVKEALRA